jgi:hypothetical protein
VSDSSSREPAEFGVLFVDGFREQLSGSAIALLAAALYRWLFFWNARPDPQSASQPTLSDVVLSSAGGEDDQPAHLVLSVPLQLSTGDRDARWLLAESSWADLFTTPRFLGLARWIWKVSTCLLVLQFVTPMRRHWHAARLAHGLSRALVAGAVAGIYVVLMGVAALVSVLLAAVLLAVALAAYLPIPRIDEAVRWVVVHISSVLGDSYMLAHCPVQFAAMRTQVAHDLAWLQGRCERVAVVAHSQGAALAHRVLKDGIYQRDSLKAFITLGQGISKFDLLWRLDWDPQAHRKAQRSRVLVTLGMGCAGLPAVGLVVGHWANTAPFKALMSLPWWPLLIAVGFAGIGWGVHQAMRAVCGDVEQDLGLPDAAFSWSDYYASADPVSNGPLAPGSGARQHQATDEKAPLVPSPCNEVYNSGSLIFDHNGYLRNQDELLSSLLNDLVAAAYGQDANTDDRPELVRHSDVAKSSQRRRQLVRWLVAARIAALGLFSALLWVNLGRALKHPMNQLMHLSAAPAGIGNNSARLLTAVLLTAAFYLTAVIVWRAAVRRSVRMFFREAVFPTTAPQSEPDVPASQATISKLPSGVA